MHAFQDNDLPLGMAAFEGANTGAYMEGQG
jgi:hypothetical protein